MLGQEKIGTCVWMLDDWNWIQRQMWNESKEFVPVHAVSLGRSEASVPSTQFILCTAHIVLLLSASDPACSALAQI